MRRARAGLHAVEHGADPALVLSYVVWPSPAIVEAETSVGPRRGWLDLEGGPLTS
jgi:hypothetical protein